jgi:hypothetical protein
MEGRRIGFIPPENKHRMEDEVILKACGKKPSRKSGQAIPGR